MNFIHHKRNRSFNKNQNVQNQIAPLRYFLKKESNSEGKRNIYLIDKKNKKEIRIAQKICNTSKDLKKFLKENNFFNPYYIKANKEYMIDNFTQFFNKEKNIYKIYNEKNDSYINNFLFEFQRKSLGPNLKDVKNIKNIFINFNNFNKYYLPNYPSILLNYVEFSEQNMYYLSYENDRNLITEIFAPENIGFRTSYFMLFSQNKSNTLLSRFSPFFILDFKLLNEQKTIKGYKEIIDECICSLFTNYQDYFDFYKSINNDLMKTIYMPLKSLNLIIRKYLDYYKFKSYDYRITCIINKYLTIYDKENELNSFIQQIENKKIQNIRLIIRYSLEEKYSNEKLLYYLKGGKKDYYKGIYYNTLYLFLNQIPCKFEHFFQLLGYTISNWIQLQNCKTEKNGEYIIQKREKELLDNINHFYKSNEKRDFYMNLANSLIGKKLDLNEITEDLILNIPLEIYSIIKYGEIQFNSNIIIKFRNNLSKKITNELCESSIISILNLPIFNNLEKFIQGGIEEIGIKVLIKTNKTPFGDFKNNIYYIDCILNNDKENYKKMNIQKINYLIKNNTKIKLFREKYLNNQFNGNNFLILQENFNGKDFDFVICQKSSNKMSLGVIQSSINKKIHQIKKIIQNLDKKKEFILTKFNTIFPKLNFKNFHILFIFSIQNQEINTIGFCKKFNIPFIFFDRKTLNFIDSNYQIINSFQFNEYTLYNKNWEKCCEENYYSINDNLYFISEEEIEEDDIEEKNNNINSICLNYDDLIFDENKKDNKKNNNNNFTIKNSSKKKNNIMTLKNNEKDSLDKEINEEEYD